MYLEFDFEKFKAKDARKIFGVAHGHGKVSTPNWGVRGSCRDYSERIKALQKFFELSAAEQTNANKKYREDVAQRDRKKHKENYIYLNSKAAKLEAISKHPRGIDIAQSIQFETGKNFYHHGIKFFKQSCSIC